MGIDGRAPRAPIHPHRQRPRQANPARGKQNILTARLLMFFFVSFCFSFGKGEIFISRKNDNNLKKSPPFALRTAFTSTCLLNQKQCHYLKQNFNGSCTSGKAQRRNALCFLADADAQCILSLGFTADHSSSAYPEYSLKLKVITKQLTASVTSSGLSNC